MNAGRAVLFAAALATAVAGLSGCRAPSEEELIRMVIIDAAEAAEEGDLESVMARLSAGYVDGRGRDKDDTRAMVADYLRRFRGIVVHVLGQSVDVSQPGARAAVTADVLLSSGAAEVFRKLVRFAGEPYRFELELEKGPENGWRISYAEWRPVPLSELFPESLKRLRELFPGI